MKSTQRIPLNETKEIANEHGENVSVHMTRTVGDEIVRLRNSGMEHAARRLEASCDDIVPDEQRPVDTNSLLGIPSKKADKDK